MALAWVGVGVRVSVGVRLRVGNVEGTTRALSLSKPLNMSTRRGEPDARTIFAARTVAKSESSMPARSRGSVAPIAVARCRGNFTKLDQDSWLPANVAKPISVRQRERRAGRCAGIFPDPNGRRLAAKKGVPMGCGASIHASSDKPAKKGWFGLTRQPPPAAAAPTRITTPPEGLRIEANARMAPAVRRHDVGMAATPVGKQAEEFKFFCPLCMMFYRNMREMPCCQQYTQQVEAPSWLCHSSRCPKLLGLALMICWPGPPSSHTHTSLAPTPTPTDPDPDPEQVHLRLLPRRLPTDEAVQTQPPARGCRWRDAADSRRGAAEGRGVPALRLDWNRPAAALARQP